MEDNYLDEKMLLIEHKLNEEFQLSQKGPVGWLEVLLLLVLAAFAAAIVAHLLLTIGTITYQESRQLSQVRLSALSRRRLLLQKEILNFAKATTLFPDGICQDYSIPSLENFVLPLMQEELGSVLDNITSTLHSPDRLL